ncbi:MAG TPA: hypothetical protein VIU44_07930 [Gaiellaceae bacterium]
MKQLVAESLKTEEGREALKGALAELTQPPPGKKKGVEMLREAAVLSMALVALYQPKRNETTGVVTVTDTEKLQGYLAIAVRATSELATFESPKFKAIALTEVPPAPPPAAAGVDGKAIRKMTQQDAANAYMRLVRGEKV